MREYVCYNNRNVAGATESSSQSNQHQSLQQSQSRCCCCCYLPGSLTRRESVQIRLLREAIRPPHWAHVLWPVCISTPSSGVSGVIVLSCIVIRPTLPSELAIDLEWTSSNPLEHRPDGWSSNLRFKDLPRARLEPATQWVTSGLPTTKLFPIPQDFVSLGAAAQESLIYESFDLRPLPKS